MDLGYRGKTALVTGGTRGIGRAIVEKLVQEGCNVAFCARQEQAVLETSGALSSEGVKVIGQVVDVSVGEAYRHWLRSSAEALGGIGLFVPNVSAGASADGDTSWQKALDVDVLGSVRGADVTLPFLAQSKGAMVIIGSAAAVETFFSPTAYNAMKAALITYGKQLAEAVAGHGIRGNLGSPGPVEFPGGAWDTAKQTMPEAYQQTLAQHPTGRLATPDDVANAVLFLGSRLADHITGTNLIVDGGFTKRVQF